MCVYSDGHFVAVDGWELFPRSNAGATWSCSALSHQPGGINVQTLQGMLCVPEPCNGPAVVPGAVAQHSASSFHLRQQRLSPTHTDGCRAPVAECLQRHLPPGGLAPPLLQSGTAQTAESKALITFAALEAAVQTAIRSNVSALLQAGASTDVATLTK